MYNLIQVPVKTLTIMPIAKSIQISENKTTTFTCNTSYSRPIPEIQWILKNHSHLELIGEQTNKTNIIGLTSAESALNYKPSRTNNGWKLCCIVTKSEVQKEEISSSLISINVTCKSNRLKQTEYATFAILPFCAFLRDFILILSIFLPYTFTLIFFYTRALNSLKNCEFYFCNFVLVFFFFLKISF
jgi:hypothetical protein